MATKHHQITSTDLEVLAETVELECKLAAGKSGKGELPKDFWKTYSAFANTRGGVVLLGIEEKPKGKFTVAGVLEPERIITDLFNQLNNPSKVNVNVLNDDHIEQITVKNGVVIKITIPPATRQQRPIYLNNNPFTGCYKRLHEGDRLCSQEEVKRMLAEQVEDGLDKKILVGYGWQDINQQTFSIYRQMLRDTKPNHPFLEQDDFGLLKKIKGWGQNRQTGEEGLTLAGLLMFGTWEAIQDAAPHYFVDYQERSAAKKELRWIDRLVPDGTWSGNVFDFYRIVYRKLTNPENFKIPFRLESGQRQDDTPVHVAIREALVNTLVHADYTGRVSVLVVKKPDMLGFRNPGNMRIPMERALVGGDSDCRNRLMHQIFLMIGVGERAGSGIPKIYSGWEWGRWRKPALYEIDEPPQTLLELRMLSLMPEGVQLQLKSILGDKYSNLSHLEHLILCTAFIETVVRPSRITEISAEHPHDISLAFQSLVKQNLLTIQGYGRGAVYYLKDTKLPTPELVFGEAPSYSVDNEAYSVDNEAYSVDNEAYSVDNEFYSVDNEAYDPKGRLLSDELTAPVIHDLKQLDREFLQQILGLAKPARIKKRLNPKIIQQLILELCTEQFITRNCLAEILKRNPDALRNHYLNRLIDNKFLALAFPQSPNDKRQAYITTKKGREQLEV